MSPQKHASQIANASHSTGPRTAEGQNRSSRNSLKHGLCSTKHLVPRGEREAFDLHYNESIAALAPIGIIESQLAEAIILDQWRLIRARNLEGEIFARGFVNAKIESIAGGETWLAHAKELALLTLYEQRINRALARNKAEFETRQTARLAAEQPEPAQPQPQPTETKSTSPDPGFVHSSPEPQSANPILVPTETQSTAAEPVPIAPEPARRAA
jgi:hypothetical protein